MKNSIRNILLGALLAIGVGVPYLQAADVAISALPAGSALAGTEPIPAVQGGATVKTTPAALAAYLLTGSSTTEVLANNGGAFDGDSGFTFNATNNTVDLGGATLTASDPVLDLSQTFNNAAVAFTGLKANFTQTAKATGTRLFDVQSSGASAFRVESDGNVVIDQQHGAFSSAIFSVRNGGIQKWSINTAGNMIGGNGSTISLGPNDYYDWSGGAALRSDTTYNIALRAGTNPIGFRVYDTYTDSSNYGRLALNTSLTGDWVQVAAETAGTGADDYGIAITPSGTGAISAQVPDSTATGGNARGTYAVDFQRIRAGASQVASGSYSYAQGQQNTASGQYSFAHGTQNTATGTASIAFGAGTNVTGDYSFGAGYDADASGIAAAAFGYQTLASGQGSTALGRDATTRGLVGAIAYGSLQRSAKGDAQVILQPVRRTTTDATPVSLATDGTPAATTVMVLPADSTLMCTAMVVAQSASAANNAGYEVKAVIQRDGANNTALVGTATTTTVGEDTAGMDATIVANDTLESAEIQVTGVAATTIQWVGELKCVQVL